MSPVPEPMQGDRVGPGGGEDNEFIPSTGLVIGPIVSSSDDELDTTDVNAPPHGYEPLPQDNDGVEEEGITDTDYNSLSGLMSAFSTHGPNVVPGEDVTTEEDGNQEVEEDKDVSNSVMSDASPQTLLLVHESSRQQQMEVMQERAAVWNSTSSSDCLELDSNKVEEIKSAMASITLPQSAIPAWAHNISEEDWKNQIAGLLSKRTNQ